MYIANAWVSKQFKLIDFCLYLNMVLTQKINDTVGLTQTTSASLNTKHKDQLYDITLLRILAIFLVVMFHSIHMLTDGTHLPDSTEIYTSKYGIVNGFINSFNMPLFIFVSGFLYSFLENEKGKYKSFKGLLRNKAKRLLLPFFIFMAFMMVTLRDFHWEPWFSWSYCHLWFLPMLFWCFIFTKLQSFVPCNNSIYWISGILILSGWMTFYNFDFPNILGVSSFIRWYFWFYFGYQISKVRNIILTVIFKYPIITITFLLSIFSSGIILKLNYPGIASDVFYGSISILSMIFLLYAWANLFLLKIKSDKFFRYLKFFSKLSFGVYLLHYYIQPMLIGTTLTGIFGLGDIAKNHPVIFPIVYVLISLWMSLLITWLLIKTRFGRFVLC